MPATSLPSAAPSFRVKCLMTTLLHKKLPHAPNGLLLLQVMVGGSDVTAEYRVQVCGSMSFSCLHFTRLRIEGESNAFVL